MKPSFFARYAWLIMAVMAILLGPIVWGVYETFQSGNNNIHQWLPEEAPATKSYDRFREMFGADEFALVSWVGCTLDDQRLEQFARALLPPKEQRVEGDRSEWFQYVVTGPRVLRRLMEEPFELSRSEAIERLRGTLVGLDGKTTCALVVLSKKGNNDQTGALDALCEVALESCGLTREQLRLGGDAVANAAIDIESERAIRTWIGLCALIALLVAWWCLRSIRLMIMVFVVSVYSALAGTAAIHYTGGTMNLVLVVVPVLIYVLSLSAGVHLSNYYRDAVHEHGLEGAPVRAMKMGWTPCALSAGTTALGLISLCVSRIIPVRMFGFYSSLGILISLLVLFVALPAILETWPLRTIDDRTAKASSRRRLLNELAAGIIRQRRPVVAVCLGVLVFYACGVTFVQTTVSTDRFFVRGSKWVLDAKWLEETLGSLVPVEVVLPFKKPCPAEGPAFLERMELVRDIEQTIRSMDLAGATTSAATFAPPLDEPKGGLRIQHTIRRNILAKELAANRDYFLNTGYISMDAEGEELWRISARTDSFTDVDHDVFLARVQQRVDQFLRQRGITDVKPLYTGVVPLVFEAQRELLLGLQESFCLAFVMIFLMMLILLRNIVAGILVMLPNILPAVIIFGTMGWTGSEVDIGAMMTASVALGIAVDDTLHFLTWFRRALAAGASRREAIINAYQRCAPAMTQTTMIAGFGILVFSLSAFQPVSQFGLLMFILLAAALLGDLIFLPAMLATRLGKAFARLRVNGGSQGQPPAEKQPEASAAPDQCFSGLGS